VYPQIPGSAVVPAGEPGSPTVVLSTTAWSDSMRADGPKLGAPPTVSASSVTRWSALRDQPTAPLVQAINRFRRSRGLGAVGLSPALTRAAVAHVRALAVSGRFTHDWDDGAAFATWIARYYPSLPGGRWLAGENLLWSHTQVSPAAAIATWVASPAHRSILLAPAWRDLGVGIVAVDGAPGVYAGQDVVIVAATFGTRR
jgi:uncharacterized protein YkwD